MIIKENIIHCLLGTGNDIEVEILIVMEKDGPNTSFTINGDYFSRDQLIEYIKELEELVKTYK